MAHLTFYFGKLLTPIIRCNVLRWGHVLGISIEIDVSRYYYFYSLNNFSRATSSDLSGSVPTTSNSRWITTLRDRLQFTFIWLQWIFPSFDIITCSFVPYLCYRWGLQTCFIQSLDFHSTTADPEQFSLSGSCFSSRLLCRRWGFAVSRIQRFKLDKFIPWLELFSCDLGRVGVSESVVPPFTWWTASSWFIVLFVWITRRGILRKIPPRGKIWHQTHNSLLSAVLHWAVPVY